MGATDFLPAADRLSVPTDARVELLQRWLAELFGDKDFTLATASADASFRRYFRIARQGHTRVAMDAPPDKEDIQPFIRVAEMLADVGVNAPHIHERNIAQGFLLLSDLGSRNYLKDLEQGLNVDRLYADAIAALVAMQARGARHAVMLPPYDLSLLAREMQLFPDWFLAKHLKIELDAADRQALEEAFQQLAQLALAQPRVFVHRDYHSRNLMIGGGALGTNPGILDFQDAVHGPITYDLVSLLRDCYVAWPSDRVAGWVEQYRQLAAATGLDVGRDLEEFRRWFDWMGVQRHLKAIGIFARLMHRDGKSGYLDDIPRTLGYVVAVTGRYPELAGLHRLAVDRVQPALAAHRG